MTDNYDLGGALPVGLRLRPHPSEPSFATEAKLSGAC
jgi:hypothetical protein